MKPGGGNSARFLFLYGDRDLATRPSASLYRACHETRAPASESLHVALALFAQSTAAANQIGMTHYRSAQT
jgi:hypothetical protein